MIAIVFFIVVFSSLCRSLDTLHHKYTMTRGARAFTEDKKWDEPMVSGELFPLETLFADAAERLGSDAEVGCDLALRYPLRNSRI